MVVSDTHGRVSLLEQILEEQPSADRVFFLGDGLSDAVKVTGYYPRLTLFGVAGNCDRYPAGEDIKETVINGIRIVYCHGHTLGVKHGLNRLKDYAVAHKANLVLFGHTHTAFYLYENGIHFLNPGSPARPAGSCASYAVADITPTGIVCNIIPLDKKLRTKGCSLYLRG